MNKSPGYSTTFVEQVYAAPETMLGVQLARAFIRNGVPASRIAAQLGVSKPTVYAWAVGRFQPRAEYVVPIQDLIRQLTESPAV